jgi:hypothetical protein
MARHGLAFADAEEKYADDFVKMKIQPYWIETEARKISGTTFKVQPGLSRLMQFWTATSLRVSSRTAVPSPPNSWSNC